VRPIGGWRFTIASPVSQRQRATANSQRRCWLTISTGRPSTAAASAGSTGPQ
jgi:hypothetical protein